MTAPDWLKQRGCDLKLSSDGKTWFALLGNQAHYSLSVVPVGDQFGCAVRQTINGQRLDTPRAYPTREDALRGGLDDLRKALGWG